MYLIVLLGIVVHACYLGSKVAVSLFAIELGAGPFLVGTLAALYALLPTLIGVHAGRMTDVFGVRYPLLFGTLGTGFALLLPFLWRNLYALYACAALMGTAFLFFNIAIQTLTGAYGKPEDRTRHFSMLSVGYSISAFVGPMFAGFSIEYAGHPVTFLFFSLATLFPACVIGLHRRLTAVAPAQSGDQKRSALDLLRNPPLRRLVVVSALMVAGVELYVFYLPIYAHSIGVSASGIGLIMGAYGTAAFIVRFVLPTLVRRVPGSRVLAVSALVAAAGFAVFPAAREVHLLILLSFIIGLGLGCGQPLSMMLSYESSPAGRAGEVTGLRLMINNISRVIVPLISGALGSAFGVWPVFLINAVSLTSVFHFARKR
ncbi:MAG: MFS transporter [Betaproteobacteria bacterium]|nr:MFS transporter [Betaproteobacteria bacterium]